MADSKPKITPAPPKATFLPPSKTITTVCLALIALGIAAFVFTLFTDKERAWHAYLAGYMYVFIIAIGGLFFSSIQHIASAGWSVNVRRYCEAFASYIPYAFVGALVLLFGMHSLYEWTHAEEVAKDALLAHKAPYLNIPFFIVRLVIFFGLWLLFSKKLVGFSIAQDKSGSEELTHKAKGWSIGFLLAFAITFSLFTVDTLMSLQPHWFSTIYGVYCFAGLFQSTIALMIILLVYSMKKGLLQGYVSEDHLHDLGKYLFAFTVFWAYIAYSQYMLIWYANLPEETIFYLPRVAGNWVYVSLALLLGKFVIPFLALLPRWAKRSPTHLVAVSIWTLAFQYLDLYWLIYPNLTTEKVVLGLPEILIWLGFFGSLIFVVTRFLSKHPIVPMRDPRIQESLHHHVVY